MHRIRLCFLLALITSLLSGCSGLFLAGAATGGASVYDSRAMSTIFEDKTIRHKILVAMKQEDDFKGVDVSVTSFDHDVLLTGQTTHASIKVKAEKLARQIPQVKRIYNEIEITEAPRELLATLKDAWLTAKVKSKLITTPKLKSGHFKVVTENKVVYLMGKVTKEQAEKAVESARNVPNVLRVVRAFEYYSIVTDDSDDGEFKVNKQA